MTKSIAFLGVAGLAGLVAFWPQVRPEASDGRMQRAAPTRLLTQEDTLTRRWDPAWMDRQGMAPQPEFQVPVTVRTEGSVTISVLGAPFTTVAGQQRWVFGETSDGVSPPSPLPLTEPPFWSTLPFARDFYERIDSTVVASLLAGVGDDGILDTIDPVIRDSFDIGSGVTVSGDSLLRLLRRPVPNVRIARTTDSGDLEPPVMCFEIEGLMTCLKPWTAHEGFLERIAIDLPNNRKFNEVTIVGHYSRSSRETALRFPAIPCVWCGRVQVCSAGAGCP